MIPKKQTRLYKGGEFQSPEERGNCFPAVIASILEMEVADVIQIQEYYDDNDWMTKLTDWLEERNMTYSNADHFKCFHPELHHQIRCDNDLDGYIKMLCTENKDKYYFVVGRSPRSKNIKHIVIFQNGIMVHDPHPDGTGVETVEGFSMLEPKFS